MKTITLSIVLVFLVFSGFSFGSSKQEDRMKEYQERVEAKLKEFNQKLDDLKERAGKIEKESKEKFNEEIEVLRQKQETANRKLEELKSSSSKAWEKMKKEMDSSIKELEKAYDQVKSLSK